MAPLRYLTGCFLNMHMVSYGYFGGGLLGFGLQTTDYMCQMVLHFFLALGFTVHRRFGQR